MLKLLTTRPQK